MSPLLPGEAELLVNGERRRLRLTLGALAALEESFDGIDALMERLKKPTARDLLLILHALVAGGGAPLTLDLLKSSDIDFKAAAKAIGAAFHALREEAERDEKKPVCLGRDGSSSEQAP
ncbi:MAG: GTA-gp10 family protein [Amphiplicatus sp.]